MKYTVKNTYGTHDGSSHRTAWAAIKAASKREGIGWIVVDDMGNRWDKGPYNENDIHG